MHRFLFVFSGGCGRKNLEGLLGRAIHNKDTEALGILPSISS
jgi:hypothetical protein